MHDKYSHKHKPNHPLYSLLVTEPIRKRRVTVRRKRKLRRLIKQIKPWLKLKGRKDFAARKISSENAIKHGIYMRFDGESLWAKPKVERRPKIGGE